MTSLWLVIHSSHLLRYLSWTTLTNSNYNHWPVCDWILGLVTWLVCSKVSLNKIAKSYIDYVIVIVCRWQFFLNFKNSFICIQLLNNSSCFSATAELSIIFLEALRGNNWKKLTVRLKWWLKRRKWWWVAKLTWTQTLIASYVLI